MKLIATLMICAGSFGSLAQKVKPEASIQKVVVDYKGKQVNGRKLIVTSSIPMPIEQVWSNVKTPALLKYVAKGMIRFKEVDQPLPSVWKEGEEYAVKMRIFGFIPFGGKHHLMIDRVEDTEYLISTKEWDRAAKIWDHSIELKKLDDQTTCYLDSIVIYGGNLTGMITLFAKIFYRHRQKRWLRVARQQLSF